MLLLIPPANATGNAFGRVCTSLSITSSTCFYWLHQLRRICRSLDTESAKTLVHAFVTSRVDYCNTVLAGSPISTIDKLQRVLNVAARGVSGTRKFDRGLTQLRYSELHWLNVPERIEYKLGITVHWCLQSRARRAPQYLVRCCTYMYTSDVASRQRFRSANRYQLIVPRHRRSKFGRRAFSVVGPMTWNSLPDNLRDPTCSDDKFRAALKTPFSPSIRKCSALEASCVIVFYKCTITYLLTYLLMPVCLSVLFVL